LKWKWLTIKKTRWTKNLNIVYEKGFWKPNLTSPSEFDFPKRMHHKNPFNRIITYNDLMLVFALPHGFRSKLSTRPLSFSRLLCPWSLPLLRNRAVDSNGHRKRILGCGHWKSKCLWVHSLIELFRRDQIILILDQNPWGLAWNNIFGRCFASHPSLVHSISADRQCSKIWMNWDGSRLYVLVMFDRNEWDSGPLTIVASFIIHFWTVSQMRLRPATEKLSAEVTRLQRAVWALKTKSVVIPALTTGPGAEEGK
jgi:hypothetical protein